MKLMKTAEEMYEYCKINFTGDGWNKKWSLKHFSIIEECLEPDEYALVCYIGNYGVRKSYEEGNYAHAITNKRLIMAQQTASDRKLRSVPYNELNDIAVTTHKGWGNVIISTVKDEKNAKVTELVGENIRALIEEPLSLVKRIKSGDERSHVADEIRVLKSLLEEGTITVDEFEAKKKSLLNINSEISEKFLVIVEQDHKTQLSFKEEKGGMGFDDIEPAKSPEEKRQYNRKFWLTIIGAGIILGVISINL